MKNKLLLMLMLLFLSNVSFAENVFIESKNITLDKDREISIFKDEVIVRTQENTQIASDFAEYNKKTGILILKNNIVARDIKGNILKTNYAKYDEKTKIFNSSGPTTILTVEGYNLDGQDILLDDNKKIIKSNKKSLITDEDNNQIFLDNFEYVANNDIFKSFGSIKVEDKNQNSYYFSQIYIDTKKKEILGSDIKSFFNDEGMKIKKNNKPRIFANSLLLNNDTKTFNKSIYTLCDYRNNEKCPPWVIQASEMLHDQKKKTIYYDNAIIKVYNVPIFYMPKLSHPDPSVDRRSGFLPPIFSGSKNLGSGVTIPYFFAVDKDKNFTLTSKLFTKEHPLFFGEYHQAFEKSHLYADFGYTKGYKEETSKKTLGEKGHLFAKYIKTFKGSKNSENSLEVELQSITEDKYLNLYRIDSNLIDYNKNILESKINYTHFDEDVFLGFNASIFETLGSKDSNKYEYVLPEIAFQRNLLSDEKFGNLDFISNYRANQFETNKFTSFLINDFNWSSGEKNFNSGIKGQFLGHFRNLNYESKNVEFLKKDTTSEIFGALGYLSELNLQKTIKDAVHKFKPKFLIKYAPGSMRKDLHGNRLTTDAAFKIDRISNTETFETGLSSTFGFDYNVQKDNSSFDFSIAQVLSAKENKKMSSISSLDEKLSDLVASSNFKLNNKLNLSYNLSIDQNYSELNYSDVGATLDLNPLQISFNYLLENKHVGNKEYFKTRMEYSNNEKGLFSFETKRSLITNSAEFYNLSYEYINDCLRAGLVYRREFYKDSELDPEDSLMFKVTLVPFGSITSQTFSNE